jgi:hypothetical protein
MLAPHLYSICFVDLRNHCSIQIGTDVDAPGRESDPLSKKSKLLKEKKTRKENKRKEKKRKNHETQQTTNLFCMPWIILRAWSISLFEKCHSVNRAYISPTRTAASMSGAASSLQRVELHHFTQSERWGACEG